MSVWRSPYGPRSEKREKGTRWREKESEREDAGWRLDERRGDETRGDEKRSTDTVNGARLALRCLTDWGDRFTRAEIRNLLSG